MGRSYAWVHGLPVRWRSRSVRRRAALPRAAAGDVLVVRPGELGAGAPDRASRTRRRDARTQRRPTRTDHGFEEAVRVAELHVGALHRTGAPTDVVEVRPVRRAEWVNANTESLRDAAGARRADDRRGDGRRVPRGDRRAASAGDAGHGGSVGAALAVAARCAGGHRARVPRPARSGPVRHRGPAIGPRRAVVRRPEHRVGSNAIGRSTGPSSAPTSRSTR